MTFANGYTVSVQWSAGNYCSNRNMADPMAPVPPSCANAEVAVMGPDGEFVRPPTFRDDDVQGYVTPDELIEILNWTATRQAWNDSRRDMIVARVWKQWTKNLDLDADESRETKKTVRDAVNNTFVDGISDVEWNADAFVRLGMSVETWREINKHKS